MEDARRGAAQGIGEIDRVAQIDDQCYRIYHDEQPLAHLVIDRGLLQPEGEEHHQYVERIGVGYGRLVKRQRAGKQTAQMAERQIL